MSIERIVCPVLNLGCSGNATEVFVRFDDVTEQPVAVMCQMYQKNGKCRMLKKQSRGCIYSEWKYMEQ